MEASFLDASTSYHHHQINSGPQGTMSLTGKRTVPSNNWFKFLKMPLKTKGTGMTKNTLGLVQSGKFPLDGKTQGVTDKHLKRGLACSSNRPGLAAVGLSEVKPSKSREPPVQRPALPLSLWVTSVESRGL